MGFGILLSSMCSGQTYVDSLRALQGMLQEVQIGTDVNEQDFEIDADAPYKIIHTITETTEKGKQTITRFEINLALLDKKLVRYEDGKDQIRVELNSGRDASVKVYEDGEFEGYEKEAYLLAFNVDNAREMVRILKYIIPEAETHWTEVNALPQDYDELKSWLKETIGDVSVDGEQWEQNWRVDDDEHPSRFKLAGADDDQVPYRYRWNMADITEPSIKVSVKGKWVYVNLGTANRARFIQYEEDGELKTYQTEIDLRFTEVDEALLVARALRELVPLAKAADKAHLPEYASISEAFAALQTTLPDFTVADENVVQRIAGECYATYELTESDDRRETQQEAIFDFADLQAPSIEINVRGTRITVSVGTRKGENYIYRAEDGEQQNYDDEISFPVESIPQAKLVAAQLAYLSNNCSDEVSTQSFAWMQEQVEAINNNDFEQSLELLDGEDCKWNFTQLKITKKGSSEELYEFNLYDLNPKTVELEVKGKSVAVTVTTLRREEIIKNYSDGEELGYTKELTFKLTDIATAKAFAESLRQMINGCEEE